MAIIPRIDRVLADRKMTQTQLAEKIDLALMNVSRIKTGRFRAIRKSTLNAICKELKCQPGDLFEYMEDEEALERGFITIDEIESED